MAGGEYAEGPREHLFAERRIVVLPHGGVHQRVAAQPQEALATHAAFHRNAHEFAGIECLAEEHDHTAARLTELAHMRREVDSVRCEALLWLELQPDGGSGDAESLCDFRAVGVGRVDERDGRVLPHCMQHANHRRRRKGVRRNCAQEKRKRLPIAQYGAGGGRRDQRHLRTLANLGARDGSARAPGPNDRTHPSSVKSIARQLQRGLQRVRRIALGVTVG
mmetsp:Transcript_28573/g.65670  ORF Transcript_28573/g.65670 Transcript_28573/m.65670 type:complete len:221 (-) Transcript_28573:2630-3292(-)